MRVLVTRPEPDAARFGKALRARGHEPVMSPLMVIERTQNPPPAGIAEAVLLFTSANGVRVAAERGIKPAHGVFVVGPASAEAAEDAGFPVAGIAGGDVGSLTQLVKDRLSTDQPLVHVAGADLAGDLAGLLESAGFTLARWTAYRARGARALPGPASDFLQGPTGAVSLFSPRSARLLVSLIAAAALVENLSAHSAICLSAAVAEAAAAVQWRKVTVARRPDQDALIDLLD